MGGDNPIKGLVGPRYVSDGSDIAVRMERMGGLVIADGAAHFREAVARGTVYDAATPAAGVAIPAVAAFSTAIPFALQNPKGSGINMVLLALSLGVQTTGTVAPGVLHSVYQNNQSAASITGTAIVPTNKLIGASTGKGLAFVTSTFPAVPIAGRPILQSGSYTTALSAIAQLLKELFDGETVIAPGCAWGLQLIGAAAAGSVWNIGAVWAEEPTMIQLT